MPDFIGCTAVKQVANETMSVCRHRDEVDILFTREFNDLVRGFTERKHGFAGKTFCRQFSVALFQVKAVLFHFFALSQLELIKIPRHPTIGDMNEE